MKAITLFLLTLIISHSASALDLRVYTGYMDNPFKMKDEPTGSTYVGLAASKFGRTDGRSHLQYSFALDAAKFDIANADNLSLKARLRWVERTRLLGRSASFIFTGDVGYKQRNHVDQLTGQVAVDRSDNEINERYNYQYHKLSAEGILRFDKYKSMALYTYFEERNYLEDYSELSLEPLDYTEVGIQPSLRLKTESGLYMRVMYFARERDYRGLLNDDSRGINVQESTVDYSLRGVSWLMQAPLTEKLSSELYLVGYKARDNHVGTRDLQYWKIDGKLLYALNEHSQINLRLMLSNRNYLNDRVARNNPETAIDGNRQRTTLAAITWETKAKKFDGLAWQVAYTNQRTVNSDNRRSYRQNSLSLGLTFSF